MKLWGRSNSLNVTKVIWTLAELDLPYERVDAGMEFGVVDTPEYRALNFNGRIPTLEVEGAVLWESNVIVRYLSTTYGAGFLYPNDPIQRAKADMWMDWQQTTLWPSCVAGYWHIIRLPAEEKDTDVIEKSRTESGELFLQFNEALKDRDFVAGAEFSMGDIPLGCSTYRWINLPWEKPSVPHVEAWLARLADRPAFDEHVNQPLT